MTRKTFGKDSWIALFHAAGMDDAMMGRWHEEFEARWPDAHEAFLAWLGIERAEIARIRDVASKSVRPA